MMKPHPANSRRARLGVTQGGRLLDRRSERLGLFRLWAVAGGLGWLAMAASSEVWMPFVISTVALSLSGASMAQLFAAARDELSRRRTAGADNRVLSAVWMAFTAGWWWDWCWAGGSEASSACGRCWWQRLSAPWPRCSRSAGRACTAMCRPVTTHPASPLALLWGG